MRNSSARLHTLSVLGIALATRLCVIRWTLAHYGSAWFYTRGLEMGQLGASLARGAGLSSPFGPPTGPTAMIAPGYPILVAITFHLFGSYTAASALLILVAQALLNTFTVWLILTVARRFASERGAVCAALVWACAPPLLWIPTIFWDTSLSCSLLLGFAAFALSLTSQNARHRRWAIAGIWCAAAGLINPALLPSLLAMIGWAAWSIRRRDTLRGPVLAALLFLLVYGMWPLRNARVFHTLILTRTTVGYELWMGNHPGSNGFLDQSLFPTFNSRELAQYVAGGEVSFTHGKEIQALAYIHSHPLRFLHLTLLRIARFWCGTGSRPSSAALPCYALLTTPLGVLGILRLVRRREAAAVFLLIPLVLFPLPYYATHAEFRYRLVLDPVLTTLAAAAFRRRSPDAAPRPIARGAVDQQQPVVVMAVV